MPKSKVKYVDGFVFVIKKKNAAAYRKMAAKGAKMWMKYGALEYMECVGDDLRMAHVILTFPKLTKMKPNEQVWFSFIGYKSKAHRDAVNKKVMSDPSMGSEDWKNTPLPFDMKRMTMGGFKVVVSG